MEPKHVEHENNLFSFSLLFSFSFFISNSWARLVIKNAHMRITQLGTFVHPTTLNTSFGEINATLVKIYRYILAHK